MQRVNGLLGFILFIATGMVVIATSALWLMNKIGQQIFALVFLAGMTVMAISAYYLTPVTAVTLIAVGVIGSAGLWRLSKRGRHGKRRGN